MFCGWDWGSTHHGVCVIDGEGAVVKRWLVGQTDEELRRLFAELAELAELADLADPSALPIARVRPSASKTVATMS